MAPNPPFFIIGMEMRAPVSESGAIWPRKYAMELYWRTTILPSTVQNLELPLRRKFPRAHFRRFRRSSAMFICEANQAPISRIAAYDRKYQGFLLPMFTHIGGSNAAAWAVPDPLQSGGNGAFLFHYGKALLPPKCLPPYHQSGLKTFPPLSSAHPKCRSLYHKSIQKAYRPFSNELRFYVF